MDLSSLGAHSAGIWTRREALARLSRARVAAMLREGYWQSPLPGIYADGGTVLDPEQRAYAAVLASGEGAVAAGRTAARVFGLPLIDDDDPATDAYDLVNDDVAAASSRSAGAAAGNVHRRQGALPPGDVLRRRSGLLVTSPARTLFDCAGLLTYEALLCATDDALHRGLVTPGELAATAARQAWQRGAPAFRTTVRAADGRSESPAESLARLLLRSELPGLQPQIELWDTAVRLLARFDLADKAVRFAVEVDRKRGHAGAAMVNRDRRRDRRSDRLGWTTERVTWFELRREPSQTLRRVVEQYRLHLERVG